MTVALLSGLIGGLVLFALQSFTMAPLIREAETYENAAQTPTHKEAEIWRPAEGWQRTSWTAVTTVLSSIGFAAVLFGFIAFTGRSISALEGAVWGLAAFVCFVLAPALGLPPKPPGVALADLPDRQIWWFVTMVATALGLWLLVTAKRTWPRRIAGVICLATPHMIGAPTISGGEQNIPQQLILQFTVDDRPILAASGNSGRFFGKPPFRRSNTVAATTYL